MYNVECTTVMSNECLRILILRPPARNYHCSSMNNITSLSPFQQKPHCHCWLLRCVKLNYLFPQPIINHATISTTNINIRVQQSKYETEELLLDDDGGIISMEAEWKDVPH